MSYRWPPVVVTVFCIWGCVAGRRSLWIHWILHHPEHPAEAFWASVDRLATKVWWQPAYLALVFQSLRGGEKRDLRRNPWEMPILRMKEEDGDGEPAVREEVELWRTGHFWDSGAKNKHQIPNWVLKGIILWPSFIHFSLNSNQILCLVRMGLIRWFDSSKGPPNSSFMSMTTGVDVVGNTRGPFFW